MSGAAMKEEKKDDAAIEKQFEGWMVRYNKVYKDGAEKNKRFQIFKRNWERCESHNASNQGWTIAPNQYSDRIKGEVPPYLGELPYEIYPEGGGMICVRGPPPEYPLIRYSFADVVDGKLKHGSTSFKKALREMILPFMSRMVRK